MSSLAIEAAVQAGVYAALTADSALTAQLPAGAGSITAFAMPGLAMPYILIAETRGRPVGTQGHDGAESDVTLDVYSQKPGGAEARSLAGQAAAVIVADLTLAGHRVVLCRVQETATRLEADGVTYQARVVMRIISETVGVTS